MSYKLDCAGRVLDLSRPAVMGVLNVTPDSFSDGGRYVALDAALAQAEEMVIQGAAIIDVGGESTRPGAKRVSEQQEIDRVIPVIEALASQITIPVSIDTSKAAVMDAAVTAGAGFINDVFALRNNNAVETAARCKVPVCLMHMQAEPATMQANPQYEDVVEDIRQFFENRISACVEAGVDREQIIIDPGFGFGKTLEHNLTLLRSLEQFKTLDLSILVGLSRKSMIAQLLNLEPADRTHASVALALLSVHNGANIIRAHDVAATVEALAIWQSVYPNNYTANHDST